MKGREWTKSVGGEEEERWYKKEEKKKKKKTTAVAYTMQTFGSVSNTCRHIQSSPIVHHLLVYC